MSKPLTATQIRCLSAGRHEFSLGLYPDLSLADARAAAAVARADLARGKAFTCVYQQQGVSRFLCPGWFSRGQPITAVLRV